MKLTVIAFSLGVLLTFFLQQSIKWYHYKKEKLITAELKMDKLPLDSIKTPEADTKYYRATLSVDTICAGTFPFLKTSTKVVKSAIFSGHTSKDEDDIKADVKKEFGIK